MSNQLPRNSTAPLGVRDGKPPLIDRLQDPADVEDNGEVISPLWEGAPRADADSTPVIHEAVIRPLLDDSGSSSGRDQVVEEEMVEPSEPAPISASELVQ